MKKTKKSIKPEDVVFLLRQSLLSYKNESTLPQIKEEYYTEYHKTCIELLKLFGYPNEEIRNFVNDIYDISHLLDNEEIVISSRASITKDMLICLLAESSPTGRTDALIDILKSI